MSRALMMSAICGTNSAWDAFLHLFQTLVRDQKTALAEEAMRIHDELTRNDQRARCRVLVRRTAMSESFSRAAAWKKWADERRGAA